MAKPSKDETLPERQPAICEIRLRTMHSSVCARFALGQPVAYSAWTRRLVLSAASHGVIGHTTVMRLSVLSSRGRIAVCHRVAHDGKHAQLRGMRVITIRPSGTLLLHLPEVVQLFAWPEPDRCREEHT